VKDSLQNCDCVTSQLLPRIIETDRNIEGQEQASGGSSERGKYNFPTVSPTVYFDRPLKAYLHKYFKHS
jgi:hypothetical protein